jgi:hypothetical protein
VDLQQFSDWLAATGLSQSIQLSSWSIPAIQTVHILALALLFAAALIVGLRFFGRGLAVEPLHLLARRFIRLIWLMVVVLAATGALLIIAEPHRTITNPVFYLKMALLVVALVTTAWLSRVSALQPDRVAAPHRAAAALGVLLWIGIMFAGRFIAYYDPY